ncbi:MAG: hypothetical protein WD271_00365 [Acidimicrobiia bacterium]
MRLVTLAVVTLAAGATLGGHARAGVERPPGVGKPTPGSGIGTAAALDNPKCNTGEAFGPFGRFDTTTVGGGSEGPVCVKPWPEGAANGGATSQGVTADRIKVVFVTPDPRQAANSSAGPKNRVDNSKGTDADAFHDLLLARMRWYETWGRDIEVKFVASTGDDEAAQRADAVTIKAEKPFAVIGGGDVLDAELAKAKILVFGPSTTTAKALAQAPYRWGQTDAQATAINAGEVIGKQLVNKKAQFAGSEDLGRQTRTFAAVYLENAIDIAGFRGQLRRYGGKLTGAYPYQGPGSTVGDDAVAQEAAPVIVTKMKQAGVNNVILFTDVAMTRAVLDNATKQEWFPEWFMTGMVYQDFALLARSYDTQQFAHAFGITNFFPYTLPEPTPPPGQKTNATLADQLNWYWGEKRGTENTIASSQLLWLLRGTHAAGPNLTPKTFRQGLFSTPASGGAASNDPVSFLEGFGKTPGLPYDEYMLLGLDYAPVWWDTETTGPTQVLGNEGKGVEWFLNNARRYHAGTWPTKRLQWFDKSASVMQFDTSPTPLPKYAGDCNDCPSHGGPGQSGTPSPEGFIAKANGSGSVALS